MDWSPAWASHHIAEPIILIQLKLIFMIALTPPVGYRAVTLLVVCNFLLLRRPTVERGRTPREGTLTVGT
jgi:hypothetical protein